MPDYEGKNQPPSAGSWFSGFATWWSGPTPRYVTYTSSGYGGVLSRVSKQPSPRQPAALERAAESSIPSDPRIMPPGDSNS